MNLLINTIVSKLEAELATALTASNQAHDSATHAENIPDNKYDTLALEAAYLAHGQSLRVQELRQAIATLKDLIVPTNTEEIDLGSLVTLEDERGQQRSLFIGPCAGGIVVEVETVGTVQVITPSSPLGQALLHKSIDEEISIEVAGQQQYFYVIAIS